MEALEAGIDRGMQRQAMREKAARDRELYYRALEDQDAPLLSPVDLAPEDVTMADLLAGVDTAAAAELAQEARVAGAMEQALSGAGAMGTSGAMGAAPSTGAGTARAATPKAATAPPPAASEPSRGRTTVVFPESEVGVISAIRPTQAPAAPAVAAEVPAAGATTSATADSRQKALDEYRMAEAAHNEALRRGDKDVQATKARLDEASRAYKMLDPSVQEQASTLERALAADASYQSQTRGDLAPSLDNRKLELGANVRRARTALEQALDAVSIPPSEEADRESALERIIRGAVSAANAMYPSVPPSSAVQAAAIGPVALMAAQEASRGALPGAGEMAGVSTADQRMSDAVRSPQPSPVERTRARLRDSTEFGVPLSALDEALAPRVASSLGETIDETRRQEQRRLQGIEENALGAGSMAPGDLGFGATPGTPLDQAVADQQEVTEQAAVAEPEVPAQTAETKIEGTDSKGNKYTVVAGDTVSGLANQYGTSVQAIFNANKGLFTEKDGTPRAFVGRGGKRLLEGVDYIEIGDELVIPSGKGLKDGGEPGPIDPRPLTTGTGPSGEVTSSEGVLARLQRATKNNAELKSRLEAEQRKNPTSLLNPFTRFGRDITYTPALEAVSRAMLRAKRGDFGLINNLAGRPVRNDEVMGLYNEYQDFVRGAKGNAKQIVINRAIREKQKALAEKTASENAIAALFTEQLVRNGMSAREAQTIAGHASTIQDKNIRSQFLRGYQQLGADKRKVALARIKSNLAATAKGVDPLKSATGDLKIAQVISAREDQEKAVRSILGLIGNRAKDLKDGGPAISRYLIMSRDPDYPVPVLDRGKLDDLVESGQMDKAKADEFKGEYDAWFSSIEPLTTDLETARQQVTIFKKMENAMVPFLKQERQALEAGGEVEDLGEAPEGYMRARRPGTNEVYDIPIVDGKQGPVESWIPVEVGQG
tara:strand:- start:2585 stop:5416 length:2832 start_codon:yes stop_codon:yes gene_type:complete